MVEVCTQRVLCTVRHPSQPMSRLWQEIASRWCQRSVCVVLTIDIYKKTTYVVKLDTSCTVILSPMVSVLWAALFYLFRFRPLSHEFLQYYRLRLRAYYEYTD